MKNLPKLFCIVILCLGGEARAQEAPQNLSQSAPKSWVGTITARTLNVRAGPGPNQQIVAKVERGDRVEAFDEDGRWVRIRKFDDSDKTGWISRSFIRLPEDFMAPAFGDLENEFLEWASARGDLSVVSVEAEDRLSLVLDQDTDRDSAADVAREVACTYRDRLSLTVPVVATVWPESGPQDGWIVQVRCP
jgi:SH3-like domain-containing protein